MYAFLFVVTIILPATQERHEFTVSSTAQFDPGMCAQRAQEKAQQIVEYAQRHQGVVALTHDISCARRETRPI